MKESSVNQLNITEFKAKCLSLLDKTAKKGVEYIITKRGEPIARVIPAKKEKRSLRGSLKGKASIHGDIVHFDTSDLWEALKE
ncbi:MAG: type II toxin-antitoxin system prevent-host-death family antitoxin [Deltaproteobacteria bacterium]|nr:type II toxin-antitoxin system prevent-host-death family antitoxin [Deltaproteobacteria bacterium]